MFAQRIVRLNDRVDERHAKKNPRSIETGVFAIGAWQFPTFAQVICTIIGAKRFHFRGRDGIGWFPLALATRQTVVKGYAMHTRSSRFGKRTRLCVDVSATRTVWVLYGQAARAISTG